MEHRIDKLPMKWLLTPPPPAQHLEAPYNHSNGPSIQGSQNNNNCMVIHLDSYIE